MPLLFLLLTGSFSEKLSSFRGGGSAMNIQNLRFFTILALILTFLMPPLVWAFEAPTKTGGVVVEDQNPQKVTKKKITDRSHPDYMRCRREHTIGSLARTRTMCMTNREWDEFARAGNASTRSLLEDVNKGG